MYIVLFVSYFSFFCLLYGRFSFILFVFVSVLLVYFVCVWILVVWFKINEWIKWMNWPGKDFRGAQLNNVSKCWDILKEIVQFQTVAVSKLSSCWDS